jgi:hypothetical protein
VSGGEGGTQRWRRHSPIVNVSITVPINKVTTATAEVIGCSPFQDEGQQILPALQTKTVAARDQFAPPS